MSLVIIQIAYIFIADQLNAGRWQRSDAFEALSLVSVTYWGRIITVKYKLKKNIKCELVKSTNQLKRKVFLSLLQTKRTEFLCPCIPKPERSLYFAKTLKRRGCRLSLWLKTCNEEKSAWFRLVNNKTIMHFCIATVWFYWVSSSSSSSPCPYIKYTNTFNSLSKQTRHADTVHSTTLNVSGGQRRFDNIFL